MTPPLQLSLVAAMGSNRVIGNGPDIPWKIPGEQKIFRRLTEGKTIVMGRKTFDSIGKPLPNRTTIIVTRNPGYVIAGCLVAHSLDEAIAMASKLGPELLIAGGAEIYAQALPRADRLYLTEIHQAFDGDAFFPAFSAAEFNQVSTEEIEASIPYAFSVYERLKAA